MEYLNKHRMPNTSNEYDIFRATVLGTGQELYILATGQFTLLNIIFQWNQQTHSFPNLFLYKTLHVSGS
jgi:hypothetical protein